MILIKIEDELIALVVDEVIQVEKWESTNLKEKSNKDEATLIVGVTEKGSYPLFNIENYFDFRNF